MSVDAATHAFTDDSLQAALSRFELLPSLLFHPGRTAEWLPAHAQSLPVGAALHRHASAGLLRRLGLGRIADRNDPVLALCAAPDALFGQLTLAYGLVLLGPMLRRLINRTDVRLAREQIGTEGLDFARAAAHLWNGEPSAVAQSSDPHGLRAQALRLGEALMAAAMEAGTLPVARRGLLRLPADAPLRASALPQDLQSPGSALVLARDVMADIDPTWHSSFPDPR